jgi:hypothetical protein
LRSVDIPECVSLHRQAATLWQSGPPHDYPQYLPFWLKIKADHLEREMLKNVSEVTFVTKNIFFQKILNFVQSFMECKVSLADGTIP